MPVIKIGGKAKSPAKPAAKKTASKPAAKKAAPAKRTASKPAAKKTTAKTNGTVRRQTPKIDTKVLDRHVKALTAAGDKRRKTEEAHQAAVENVHEVVTAAIEAKVPMSIIADSVGVSRQWLYKMGNFRERTNGSSSTRKTAAKKPAARASATKSKTKPTIKTRTRKR
jgi:isopropylmalate/homocitrate/citramalate synthase